MVAAVVVATAVVTGPEGGRAGRWEGSSAGAVDVTKRVLPELFAVLAQGRLLAGSG